MRLTAVLALLVLAIGQVFASGTSEDRISGIFGIDDVTVKGEWLDVSVTGTGSDVVDMTSTSDGDFRVRHELMGGTLNVWVEKYWPLGFGGRGTIRLRIPRSASLHVQTASGQITVRGLSGDSCELKTVSGRILAENVAGDLWTQSVSGGIQLSRTRGSITAKTVSGTIIGDDVTLLDDSTFSSVSGRIDIHPSTPLEALRFDLSSISGQACRGHDRGVQGAQDGVHRTPGTRAVGVWIAYVQVSEGGKQTLHQAGCSRRPFRDRSSTANAFPILLTVPRQSVDTRTRSERPRQAAFRREGVFAVIVASLAEIKAKFSAYLQEAEASGPVVITRKGRAVAVIVAPADDNDLEAILLSRSPRFRSLLSRSRKSIGAGRGETHEQFWRRESATKSSS